ncbi:Splicing factor 45 [Chytridiales sp. JEL 0842]|nr:Splicing factor 45 [Chytridiales sp. JEL 0842]
MVRAFVVSLPFESSSAHKPLLIDPAHPNEYEVAKREIRLRKQNKRYGEEELEDEEAQQQYGFGEQQNSGDISEESDLDGMPMSLPHNPVAAPSREISQPNTSVLADSSGEDAYMRRMRLSQAIDVDTRPAFSASQPIEVVSTVVMFQNMVGPGEVDDDLEEETASECSKFGPVERCVIYEGDRKMWNICKRTIPAVHGELDRNLAAELLAQSSSPQTSFEPAPLERPGDGAVFVVSLADGAPVPPDGWNWPEDESHSIFKLKDGRDLLIAVLNKESTGPVASASTSSPAIAPKAVNEAPSRPAPKKRSKAPVKAPPPPKPVEDEAEKQEDLSLPIPSAVALARYRRNHEYIEELFSMAPKVDTPKDATVVKRTQDDIDKIMKEIDDLKAAHEKRLRRS